VHAHFRCLKARRAAPTLAAIGVIFVVTCSLCFARGLKDLEKCHDKVRLSVEQAKRLAMATLVEIRTFEGKYYDAKARPLNDRKSYAARDLARIDELRRMFDASSESADKEIVEFDRQYGASKPESDAARDFRSRVDRQRSELNRYKSYVTKFYGHVAGDFGPPISGPGLALAAQSAAERPPQGLLVKGEVNGSLGGASYKRPNADPKADYSSADFGLKLVAATSPAPGTDLSLHFGQQSTVQQRKIALTNFGAGAVQRAGDNFTLDFNFDYDHYSDRVDKTLSYGDFSIGSGGTYRQGKTIAKARIKHVSRSYGKNKSANYGILTFNPDVNLPVGRGSLATGFGLLTKSNEVLVLNHKEFSPFARWELAPGGSVMDFQYQSLTHPKVKKDTRDSKRTKLSWRWRKAGGFGSATFGPEVAIYRYPNANRENYSDVSLVYDHSGSGAKSSTKSFRAVYRIYGSDQYFDFAQLTYRVSKRPFGAGFGWQLNLAGRLYTESSDKNDPLRFSRIHDPHTLDYFHELAWYKTGERKVREFVFGPIIGAKFYFDTERNNAFQNDVDYIWKNPRNTALWGLHLKGLIQWSPLLRMMTGVRYQSNILYNASPTRSYYFVDFNISTEYNLGESLLAEGRLNIHLTRANIKSDTDLDQTELVFLVRYLFDLKSGS